MKEKREIEQNDERKRKKKKKKRAPSNPRKRLN